jgi:hypothetical protein
VQQQNGHLALLVINKSATDDDTATFNVAGFTPSGTSTLWTYGQAEDTAQSLTADGSASLTQTSPVLGVAPTPDGSTFDMTFPAYSMSVLDLEPVGNAGPQAVAPDSAPGIGIALVPRPSAQVSAIGAPPATGAGDQGGTGDVAQSGANSGAGSVTTVLASSQPSSQRTDEGAAGIDGVALVDTLLGLR